MSGPQDPAATGLDGLRAAHADREHAIKALKHAFVQGRLTRDELGARAGNAFAARTYGELAAVTADIPDIPDEPAGPAAAGPGGPPGWARRWPLAKAVAGSGAFLGIAFAAVVIAGALDDQVSPSPDQAWIPLLLCLATIAMGAALLILSCGVTISAEQRRLRGQLPTGRAGHPAA
jgi:hypothetical protein